MSDVAQWQSMLRNMREKNVYREAGGIVADLDAASKAVAAKVGGAAGTFKGTKDAGRATEKVMQDYGGDWWRIKDLARCTIVVDSRAKALQAVAECESFFRPVNGWSYVETKHPPQKPDGYSDWKVIVSRHGSKAEVQINTKSMIYAKDMPFFLQTCAADLSMMKATYALPGGLGHWFYEIARTNRGLPMEAAADAAGIPYYSYFRSEPPDPKLAAAARAALASLPPPPVLHA